ESLDKPTVRHTKAIKPSSSGGRGLGEGATSRDPKGGPGQSTRSSVCRLIELLALLQRSLVLVQPPGVVERVDRTAVSLVGQVVLHCRPGQRELRCEAG